MEIPVFIRAHIYLFFWGFWRPACCCWWQNICRFCCGRSPSRLLYVSEILFACQYALFFRQSMQRCSRCLYPALRHGNFRNAATHHCPPWPPESSWSASHCIHSLRTAVHKYFLFGLGCAVHVCSLPASWVLAVQPHSLLLVTFPIHYCLCLWPSPLLRYGLPFKFFLLAGLFGYDYLGSQL